MLKGASYVGYGQCRITGSDLASDVDNMATRLAKLEQIVELLTGMDVSADSLDQISQSLGTVTDATLINAAGGWSTEGTFSGVAISTLGWTMYNPCTGQDEPFPIVVTNPDGSLNFGATTNGTLCGSSVNSWDTAAAAISSGIGSAYADVGWHQNNFTTVLGGSGITYSSSSRGTATGLITLHLAAGTYLATGFATQYVLTGDGTPGDVINGFLTIGAAGKVTVADTTGTVDSAGGARETAAVGGIFVIPSPTNMVLEWTANVMGSCTFQAPFEFGLTVLKIG